MVGSANERTPAAGQATEVLTAPQASEEKL